MADGAQHQVLGLQDLALAGHVLVQREHAGRLAADAGQRHPAHLDHALLRRPQRQHRGGVRLGVRVGGYLGAGLAQDVVDRPAGEAGHLDPVQLLGFGVGVHDLPGLIFQDHAHRGVAEDRVQRAPLASQRFDQAQAAEDDAGLPGQHRHQAPRLGR